MNDKNKYISKFILNFDLVDAMGVARGKSGWGSFPKGHRPRAGCGAEPHCAPQAEIFWGVNWILQHF